MNSLLSDHMDGKTLLVMGFYHCKHMCNYVIKDLSKKLATFKDHPKVIYFGIDENEGPRDALQLSKRIIGPRKGNWEFFVSDKKDIERLASFLNFEMKRDPVSGTIIHELGLYSFDNGKFITKLPDLEFTETDLGEAKSLSMMDSVKKFCSEFSPSKSKYGPLIMRLLTFASGLFLIFLVGGFFYLRRESA